MIRIALAAVVGFVAGVAATVLFPWVVKDDDRRWLAPGGAR